MEKLLIFCICINFASLSKAQLLGGILNKATESKREKEMTKGAIILSHKPIEASVKEQENETLIAGEKIFCKFILKETLTSYKGMDYYKKPIDVQATSLKILVSFFEDEKVEREFFFFPNGKEEYKTKKEFYLVLGNDSIKDSPFYSENSSNSKVVSREEKERLRLMNQFVKLNEGTYKIRMRVWTLGLGINSEFPVADKSFNFEKKKDHTIKVGYDFGKLQSNMENKIVKDEITKYIKTKSIGYSPSLGDVLLDIKLLDKDWTIVRDVRSSIITHRKIKAASLYKLAKGGCQIACKEYYFSYNGTGFQNSVDWLSDSDVPETGVSKLFCDCP